MTSTDVPRMTYVLPLRNHLTFTANSLPSIILNSSREHEIIIVLDKCPFEYEFNRRNVGADGRTIGCRTLEEAVSDDREVREDVYRWFDAHQKVLDEHHVRVLDFHGDERCWTGGLRAGSAMNMGMREATADYVVVFGDEDLLFMPGWDRAMWDALKDHDPMRTVALPVLTVTGVCDPYPFAFTPEWIHAQRKRLVNHLAYPVVESDFNLLSGRFPLENFAKFVAIAKQAGCVEEMAGVRGICHWVPLIMHRKLFDQIGGYPTGDNAAFGYDIVLDDTLAALGVKKRMPLDHMMLHTKFFAFMSDEVDRVWGDPASLARIQKRMIP